MKAILKLVSFGSIALALLVGCHKDSVVPITPGGDSDTVSETVIEIPTFDTIPCSMAGFDIKGTWVWARPNTPNHFMMTFKDSIVVIVKDIDFYYPNGHFFSDYPHSPFIYYDSLQYIFKVDTLWYSEDSIMDILYTLQIPYVWRYQSRYPERERYSLTCYDNQNTLFLDHVGPSVSSNIPTCEYDCYLVRLNEGH